MLNFTVWGSKKQPFFALQVVVDSLISWNLWVTKRDDVFCLQDGRDGAVAAAESNRRGADRCGHGGHHEGLQGKLRSHEGPTLPDSSQMTTWAYKLSHDI